MEASERPPEEHLPVAVIGAGQIGRSVGHAFSEYGPVILMDRDPAALRSALKDIRRAHLSRLFHRASSVPLELVMGRIKATTDLTMAVDGDLIIENITEDLAAKKEVHGLLNDICRPDVLVAVNTSVIPVGLLAGRYKNPGRLLGMHFMIPVPETRHVELIVGSATSGEAADLGLRILREINVSSTVVTDSPGFVANRVLMLMVNEAATLVRNGVASVVEIDEIFTKCNGHRLGPLATADLIGLDTMLYSLRILRYLTGNAKFDPDEMLVELVKSDRLGRKSSIGFHNYGRVP